MSRIGLIHRYLIVIQVISRNKYINMEQLEREVTSRVDYYNNTGTVGISDRTIYRDIKNIREELGIDIIYSKKENGYYIQEKELEQSDFDRLLEPFDILGSLYADKKLPDFVFVEKLRSKGTEHLLSLVHAIERGLIIEFHYLKFNNTSSHTRRVEPYALKEFKGRWYLLAIEIGGRLEELGKIKTWGLDRIQNLYITNSRFKKNARIDIEKEFEDAFGIFADREKGAEEVILSFSSVGCKYNETLPLHKSQEVLIENEKELRVRLNVKLTYDFVMELLSQSEYVTVIKPNHLKKMLINIHEKALKQLKG